MFANLRQLFRSISRPPKKIRQSTIRDLRVGILKGMIRLGIPHFTRQLQVVSDRINEVITDRGGAMLRDDLWDRVGDVFVQDPATGSNVEWWRRAIPGLSILDDVELFAADVLRERVAAKDIAGMVDNIGDLIPHQQVVLFKAILQAYFTDPAASKTMLPIFVNMEKAVDDSQSKADTISAPAAFLRGVFLGTGPFMLKMLQQLNSRPEGVIMPGVSVSDVIGGSMSKTPTMTPQELALVLRNTRLRRFASGKEGDDESDEADEKGGVPVQVRIEEGPPLASASIAQVHRTTDGNILKIMRPLSLFMFMCELQYFLQVVWRRLGQLKDRTLVMQTRQLILFMLREFSLEFRYDLEAANTLEGERVYDKTEGGKVRTVQLLAESRRPLAALLLSRVPGRPMDQVIEEIGRLPRASTERRDMLQRVARIHFRLIRQWFGALLWPRRQPGFFHADPHAGNIHVPSLQEMRDDPTGAKDAAWLLDFGIDGRIGRAKQCQIKSAMVTSGRMYNFYKKHLYPADIEGTAENREETKLDQEPGTIHLLNFPVKFREPEAHAFLEFFGDMQARGWSIGRQARVLRMVRDPSMQKKHRENLRLVRVFQRQLRSICGIAGRKEKENESKEDGEEKERKEQDLSSIMSYDHESGTDFGHMFFEFVRTSDDIGTCGSDEMILFARALGYLAGGRTLLSTVDPTIERWIVSQKMEMVDAFMHWIKQLRHISEMTRIAIGMEQVC